MLPSYRLEVHDMSLNSGKALLLVLNFPAPILQIDFRSPLFFAHLHNANLPPTPAQARCLNIKGAQIIWNKLDERKDCDFCTLPVEELRLYLWHNSFSSKVIFSLI